MDIVGVRSPVANQSSAMQGIGWAWLLDRNPKLSGKFSLPLPFLRVVYEQHGKIERTRSDTRYTVQS